MKRAERETFFISEADQRLYSVITHVFLLRTDCLSQLQTLGTPSLAPGPPPSNSPIGESYTVPPPELEPNSCTRTQRTPK